MAQAHAHGESPYAAGTRGVQEAGGRSSSRLAPRAKAADHGGVRPRRMARCGRMRARAPLALAHATTVPHPYVLALAL